MDVRDRVLHGDVDRLRDERPRRLRPPARSLQRGIAKGPKPSRFRALLECEEGDLKPLRGREPSEIAVNHTVPEGGYPSKPLSSFPIEVSRSLIG